MQTDGRTFIVDTREQNPFWKGVGIFKTTLNVGDYTILGLLNIYHIERKSLVDLYGTITKGHYRFKKEILRSKHNQIKLEVVVEGTKKDFEAKKFHGGQDREISGETLIKIITGIERNHNLKFHWCKDRKTARSKTKRLLLNFYKQLNSNKHGYNKKTATKKIK